MNIYIKQESVIKLINYISNYSQWLYHQKQGDVY